jgi:hypothetical protein
MIRALVKRLTTANFRYSVRTQRQAWRERGVGEAIRWNGILIDAVVRERLHRSSYVSLDERALKASRKSDTVYVFGSGYSLNQITPAQWQTVAQHDTFGFNMSIHQRWVRMDYHLLRGGVEGSPVKWRLYAEDFCRTIEANPRFQDTILLLQGEYYGQFGNQLVGYRLLRPGARVFRFRTAREDGLPTHTFAEGLRHMAGTLTDAINAAVLTGWKHIVLLGVDLYDSRYFWLQPDEVLDLDQATGLLRVATTNLRGLRPGDAHNTTANGIVQTLGEWRDHLVREHNVELSVANPRSLLAAVMPVHEIRGS